MVFGIGVRYNYLLLFLFAGKTYFLKGDQFWDFYDVKMRTKKKEGTHISKLLKCRNGKLKEDLKVKSTSETLSSASTFVMSPTYMTSFRYVSALFVVCVTTLLLH